MRTLVRRSLLIPLLLLGLPPLHAQWTNVAPGLIPVANSTVDPNGAMFFSGGKVWAGVSLLWESIDQGATWTQCKSFPSAIISDIVFYDNLHGLVSTEDQGIFITSDGGLSWLQWLKTANLVKAGYDGSFLDIITLEIDGPIHISHDGGATWGGAPLANSTYHSFAIARDGTLYLDGYGNVLVSNDRGLSWNATSGTYNSDCWTLSVDSCNSKQLYLANEEIRDPLSTSNFYLSLDGGQSWQSTDSHKKPYLSGAMATTYDAIFLGSMDGSGIHRSMDYGVTWKAIGGPTFPFDTRSIAIINDNFILASDSAGNIWRTMNGGGDSVQSSVKFGTFSMLPLHPFVSDTLGCDSLVRWVHLDSVGCPAPYLIAPLRISGPDSANFSMGTRIGDSIPIIFYPNSIGAQNDSLVALLNDSTSVSLPLGGYVSQYSGTVTTTPNTLFLGDTVHCDSMMGTVHLQWSGCRIPPANFFVAGPDSTSFRIVDSTRDSISILWKSQQPGTVTAWLVAKTATGQSDSVSLSGISTTAPTTFSHVPSNLFSGDTLYVGCDPAIPKQIVIYDTACLWPNVVSEQIVGPGSGNYIILKPSDSTIVDSDLVQLSFLPSDTGNDSAMYVLVLNDTTFSIPLAGIGMMKHILQLTASTQNVKTDTIGGEVEVPILIDTLARPETVELSLEYPLADLVYDSTVDGKGVKVDIPGDQSPGHTRIRVQSDSTGIIHLYARFKVFSDTDYKPVVTFDSLTVPSELATCAYSYPPSLTDTISPLEGCAVPLLSLWIHFHEPPLFRIIPNPTPDGNIQIGSTQDVGPVSIEVYDALGTDRASVSKTITSNSPSSLDLPFESGIYFLRITSSGGVSNLSVLIKK